MRYFVVDAFADALFTGNPAGICLLDEWPEDRLMQRIAFENNLPETAFIVPAGREYALRWFTPETEIDLCGHATLASAYVVASFVDPAAEEMYFTTRSGMLTVRRDGESYELDFPARMPELVAITPQMENAIGVEVLEAHRSRDLMLVVQSEEQVQNLRPDLEAMKWIPHAFAVIVTAKGDSVDFVSRFFAPNAGIPEDPVTGSAHCTLIPYWAGKLNRKKMVARQLSRRGGTLYCEDRGERVRMAGRAQLYMTGELKV